MPKKGLKSIAVSDEVYDKLKALAHPGQSFAGVIKELIERHDKLFNTPKENK